jgi:hypothetical protein
MIDDRNISSRLSHHRHRREINIYQDSVPKSAKDKKPKVHINEYIKNVDLFYPSFGLYLKHIGYYNPTMKNYLVTLKYDFNELRSYTWLSGLFDPLSQAQPTVTTSAPNMYAYLKRFMGIIDWFKREDLNQHLVHNSISIKTTCDYINSMYYNDTLNMHLCSADFKSHRKNNVFSYYTLKSVLDLADHIETEQMGANLGRRSSMLYIHNLGNFNLSHFRPFAEQMLVNVTLQYMQIRFAQGLHSDAKVFQAELDTLLTEVNAYIPHFTTDTGMSPRRQKRFIVAAAFTVASGIFSAWRFYKDYQFKKNLRRSMTYILNRQKDFKQGILTNHKNLLSLADITALNFKKLRGDFTTLRAFVQNKFATYGNNMLHIHSKSMYYNQFGIYFSNILQKVNHDLNHYNSKLQMSKSLLYTKTRSFVSGLHILAENKLPESILHANVFSNILHNINEELKNKSDYTLLYGSEVNPYYHMPIAKSFIIDNVLYINIMLPLRHKSTPIMKLYLIESHYLPTNMSTPKTTFGSYTRLYVEHKYMILNDFHYAFLNDDFDKWTIQHDGLHVPTTPLLIFTRNFTNCYVNIVQHSPASVITDTCSFKFYRNISVSPTLVATSTHYFLMNVQSEFYVKCSNSKHSVSRTAHSISIIKRTALCRCTINIKNVLLIGSETNCSNSHTFSMQYTYNFVTEWLSNQLSIRFYTQGFNFLNFPSNSYFPSLNIAQTVDNSVYNENSPKAISLDKLSHLVDTIRADKPIFLTKADRNSYFYGNSSSAHNDNEDILDLNSWFGPEIQSSMIFMFISGIIAIIAFVLLIFLCVKYVKLHHSFLYNIGSHSVQADNNCHVNTQEFYLHIGIAILLIFASISLFFLLRKLWSHLNRYKTLLHFTRISKIHSGNVTKIALEISTMQNSVYVHLAYMHTPIALLCMDPRTTIPHFMLKDSYLSPTLNFLTPILLHHSDCKSTITTPTVIPLGIYQYFQILKFLKENHLIRLVAFQQNTLIPLSNIIIYDKTDTNDTCPDKTIITGKSIRPTAPDTRFDYSVTVPPGVEQRLTEQPTLTVQSDTNETEQTDMSGSSHSLPAMDYCHMLATTVPTTHVSPTTQIRNTSTDLPITAQPQSLPVVSPRHILLPFPDLNRILYPKLT